MSDCLFCKIIAGEIPSNKLYEDDLCYAFTDIAPLAPTHFLVVPKAHFASVAEVDEENAPLVGHIFQVIAKLAREMGFAKAHVFAYSPRPGTAAANRPGQVPNAVKEERSRRMIAAMDEVRSAFLLSQLGRTEEVLVETTRSPLGYEGFTKNYTPVYLNCAEKLCGTICKMRLEAVLDGHCVGTLVP